MDESLFIFLLISGFVLFASIIYCFLSTCLGVQIRRSDIWDAFSITSAQTVRNRDSLRRGSGRAGEYELDDLRAGVGYDRVGMGMGAEEVEMMRRNGGRGGYY